LLEIFTIAVYLFLCLVLIYLSFGTIHHILIHYKSTLL
jgi:hypothetical protein